MKSSTHYGLVSCALILLLLCSSANAKSTSIKTAQMNNLWAASSPLNNQSTAESYPHQTCFKRAAQKYDIPVEILLALARGESNFKATAKSKSNAYGVMQILWPSTAKHLGVDSLAKLLQPCTNIDAGSRYLKELLTRYDGNVHLAMAAYNYGPGRIKKHMSSSGMPNGAIWYSQYIYDHYQTIAKRQAETQTAPLQVAALSTPLALALVPSSEDRIKVLPKPVSQLKQWHYKPDNQQVLLSFNQPYRAKGFTDYLRKKNSTLKIDWFKISSNEFNVVLRYDDSQDLSRSRLILKQHGFLL